MRNFVRSPNPKCATVSFGNNHFDGQSQMRVLCLYDCSQTYTNTVFEHLRALGRHSTAEWRFCHHRETLTAELLESFDAIILHYSVRLPFDQVSESVAALLESFDGLKALFIQDEYDHTHRTWWWIKRLAFDIVFSVVPEQSLHLVYPQEHFPKTRFVTNLTGYVPEVLPSALKFIPPSRRPRIVGYRGRPLPVRYGALAREKVEIGELVKAHCSAHSHFSDIAWTEESRIYGPAWYDFLFSCRSVLGTESGSNVFDWDGTLNSKISDFRAAHPQAKDPEIYEQVIRSTEQPGLINQISPRMFESIAAKCVLVLFEGTYSGVLQPGRHYLPLRRDGKNLVEIFAFLSDGPKVDTLAETSYTDIITSQTYSYGMWVGFVDSELRRLVAKSVSGEATAARRQSLNALPDFFAIEPIRAGIPGSAVTSLASATFQAPTPSDVPKRLLTYAWIMLPERLRSPLRGPLKKLARMRPTRLKPHWMLRLVKFAWSKTPEGLRAPLRRPLKKLLRVHGIV